MACTSRKECHGTPAPSDSPLPAIAVADVFAVTCSYPASCPDCPGRHRTDRRSPPRRTRSPAGLLMRVVYPDGSPFMRTLLDSTQLAALPDFLMYDDAPDSEDDLIARLADAWGAVIGWARINDRVLGACPSLKLISFTGTGVANFV